jgi:hypothetical protein
VEILGQQQQELPTQMVAAKVELAAADAAAHSVAQEERQVNTQTQRLVLQIQAVEAVELTPKISMLLPEAQVLS